MLELTSLSIFARSGLVVLDHKLLHCILSQTTLFRYRTLSGAQVGMPVSLLVRTVWRIDLGLPFRKLRSFVQVLSVLLALQVLLVTTPYRPLLRSVEGAP